MRLRQVVLVARDLEPVVDQLRHRLGLTAPYHDPGVAMFGLRNAVMALGDTFVEVVSPTEPDTAAGRHLERLGGDGGYMVMVQVDDIAAARRRAERMGIRTVWEIDLPDISGTHLHPRDTGGALLSLDRPQPPESWRWGGPAWTGTAPPVGAHRVTGAVISAADPDGRAQRWAELLERPASDKPEPTIALDDGSRICLVAADGRPEGLCGIEAVVDPALAGDEPVDIAGVRFRLSPAG